MDILKREFKDKPATMILISINIISYLLIWFFSIASGNDYFRHFAIHPIMIKHFNQYWRLITANFVHFDLSHIFFNMLSLYFIGSFLERYLKTLNFTIIYIVSGLLSSLVTYIFNVNAYTAGASGAIYGIMSAVFILTYVRPYDFNEGAIKQIRLIMLFNIIYTLVIPNISITGHLGGALGGLLVLIMVKRQKQPKVKDYFS